MKKLLIGFLIITGLFSCDLEKEIQYDPVYDGGKIIIHGFISQNEGVRVIVRKSVPVNRTTENDIISGAQVFLFGDGKFNFNLAEVEPGYFVSPPESKLANGVAYMIRVVTDKNGIAESSTQLLIPEVILDSLIYEKSTHLTKSGKLKYYFKDPLVSANFYSFSYKEFDHNDLIGTFPYNNEFIMPYTSDISFNGTLWSEDMFYSPPSHRDTITITGRLYNISPEYMKFLESMDDYEYTRGDPFFDHTSPVFSNIKNGYGIFGSYTFSEKSLTYIITEK